MTKADRFLIKNSIIISRRRKRVFKPEIRKTLKISKNVIKTNTKRINRLIPRNSKFALSNQAALRKAAIKRFGGKCPITGRPSKMCHAAHIFPREQCVKYGMHPYDVRNVMLLDQTLHGCFDYNGRRGDWSINPKTFEFVTHSRYLQDYKGTKVNLPIDSKPFVELKHKLYEGKI